MIKTNNIDFRIMDVVDERFTKMSKSMKVLVSVDFHGCLYLYFIEVEIKVVLTAYRV